MGVIYTRELKTNYVIAAITAYLAKGYGVPEAVSAGFKFAEEKLKEGRYFD